MNIVGDDYLRKAISQEGYFLKLLFNARAAHFFPYTTEHRDASLAGLCYRDDSMGDALAATIKPTQIDIRLHNRFSPAQIVSMIERIEQTIGNSSSAVPFDVNYGGKYISKIRLNTNASCEPMTSSDFTTRISEIMLRPVRECDLPTLFDHQREPEANEMAAFPARDRDAFLAHWEKIMADRSLIAMTVDVDNHIAGHIGSWTQDGQRQVGYWIGKEYWRRGVATQALSMFLRVVTDRPIYAYVASHNVASIRVLEKCGFLLQADFTSAFGPLSDGSEELVYVNNSPFLGA